MYNVVPNTMVSAHTFNWSFDRCLSLIVILIIFIALYYYTYIQADILLPSPHMVLLLQSYTIYKASYPTRPSPSAHMVSRRPEGILYNWISLALESVRG